MNPGVIVYFEDEEKRCHAEPGESLLDVALREGVDLDHACGGVCACSTCHVKIQSGGDLLTEAEEDEEDQLDEARDLSLNSRLGCQARILPDAEGEIRVQIPSWNINLAQEPH